MHDIDCGHWVIAERPEAFKQGKATADVRGVSDANWLSGCRLLGKQVAMIVSVARFILPSKLNISVSHAVSHCHTVEQGISCYR